MSPGDQPLGYSTTRATVPKWALVQGIAFTVSMVVVGLACGLALEDRHRAFVCIGVAGFTIATWTAAAVLKGRRRAAVVGVAAALLAFLAVLGFLQLGPQREQLPGIGDAIVCQLKAHRAACGSYPYSLESAGIRPDWTRFGSWQYEVTDGGHGYALSIGDYFADHFVLYRVAEDEDWSWDS